MLTRFGSAALAAGFALTAGLCGCASNHQTKTMESTMQTTMNVMPPKDLVLLPIPRHVAISDTACFVARDYVLSFEDVPESSVPRLLADVTACLDSLAGVTPSSEFNILLAVDTKDIPQAEGYTLDIDEGGVLLKGHDAPGLYHGVMTLVQIARQCASARVFPEVHIEDWPDFPNRGVMLDIARDKVPEMSTLYGLVDTLAAWKFNQLQLYTEHTYAYRGHHAVWEDASPMTAAQIRALDAYCKERFIELVPNQNSFGHMNRWLQHPRYASLAETPDGSDLCPVDPGSIALLADMYGDMLPNFSSAQFNVGCDETWSLGKGRSKEAVEARGVGKVYLEFLLKIHDLLQAQGRTMQFWGDIIMQHPELIPELPKDVIAMEWGYEANHPFAAHGKKFAASGIPFYVVPGTSTWNSLAGRTGNALANLRNAAENGLANGAIGYLITDWGDSGHWQFLPASYAGFAYGAAVSWACDINKDLDLPRALDVHAFADRAGVMGRLACDLGNAYRICGVEPGNSSVFYMLLLHQREEALPPKLTVEGLSKTLDYIDKVMADLPKADMARDDATWITREFTLSAAFMRFACHVGIARLEAGNAGTSALPAAKRHELAAELEPLLPEFRQVWLLRNRSGGLKDSAGRFESLLAILNAE